LQEDTIEFGKKYMEAAINMYDFPEEEKQEALDEINKGLDEFASQLPAYRDSVTQVFESINNDGFLVGGKSSIDIKIKMADFYLTIDAESSVYNINKEVSIELPEITEENSFDVLKGFMPILSGIGSAPGLCQTELMLL